MKLKKLPILLLAAAALCCGAPAAAGAAPALPDAASAAFGPVAPPAPRAAPPFGWPLALLLAALALPAAPGLAAAARAGADAARAFMRQPSRLAFVCGALLSAGAVCQADKMQSNAVVEALQALAGAVLPSAAPARVALQPGASGLQTPASAPATPSYLMPGPPEGFVPPDRRTNALSRAQYDACFALTSVTNAAHDFGVPPDAEATDYLPPHGVHDEAYWIPLPSGFNAGGLEDFSRAVPAVCAAPSGMILLDGLPGRPAPSEPVFAGAETNRVLSVLRTPSGLLPPEGRLWSADTTNGTTLVTWRNLMLGRLAEARADLQCELFPRPRTQCGGQLAKLLGQPKECGRVAPRRILGSVHLKNHPLQFGKCQAARWSRRFAHDKHLTQPARPTARGIVSFRGPFRSRTPWRRDVRVGCFELDSPEYSVFLNTPHCHFG